MQLGITSIQRNREPWIKEWVAFHYLVGFRKFYIFLDNCTDNTEKVLANLKLKFDIKIFIVDPKTEAPQLKCYQESYDRFGGKVSWMAFIDSDEFLFPTGQNSMVKGLDEFSNKKISALGVYWSCFGSSGHIMEPKGLIIENYRRKADKDFVDNSHIKSIVRGGQVGNVRSVQNPHIFETPLGTYDENLRLITSGLTNYEPTYNKFCINHYGTQSRSYYLNFKRNSGAPDGNRLLSRGEDWWEKHDRNEVLDDSMDKFIEPLKNILASI